MLRDEGRKRTKVGVIGWHVELLRRLLLSFITRPLITCSSEFKERRRVPGFLHVIRSRVES